MTVVNMVVGAPTASGARVITKVTSTSNVRVATSLNSGMTGAVYHGPVTPDAQNVAGVPLTGLSANTKHWFQVEHGGVLDTAFTGSFWTSPVSGTPTSFTMAMASCAGSSPDAPATGTVLAADRISNHAVYSEILNRDPRAFLHLGDLHYYDLSSGNHGIVGGASLANFRRAYDDVLLQPNQHALYRSTAWDYLWDDHCFLGNDKRGTEDLTGRGNALTAFKERVPSGASLPNPSDGMFHAFRYGRVLFVMGDVRYAGSANSAVDNSSKTMLGAAQKTWMNNLLGQTTADYLVWCMGSQWAFTTHVDSWGAFSTERDEMLGILDNHNFLNRMSVAYGDRHAADVWTGKNNPYGGFPMLMASALDSTPAGSPNNDSDLGPDFPGRGQYGTVRVDDSGSGLAVTLTAWRMGTPLRWHTQVLGGTRIPAGNSATVLAL